MEPPKGAGQPSLNSALDRLWDRFLPVTRERVSIIESATQSLAAGTLTVEEKEAAAAAAHKLAGVLGTFSLARGTEVARELELQFAGTPESAARLAPFAAELRNIIESRK